MKVKLQIKGWRTPLYFQMGFIPRVNEQMEIQIIDETIELFVTNVKYTLSEDELPQDVILFCEEI